MCALIRLIVATGSLPASLQPVTTLPSSSPRQESTMEQRKSCLQWPEHLVLVSIIIGLVFFWMLPCNIISLVCTIIVSAPTHQHCTYVYKCMQQRLCEVT